MRCEARSIRRRGGRGAFIVLLIVMGLLVMILPFMLPSKGPAPNRDGAPIAAPTPPDAPKPIPLDRMEPAVRAQFEAALAAVERTPDAASYGQVGMLCQAYEFPGIASSYYDRAIALDGTARRWRRFAAMVRREIGDLDGAATLLDGVLADGTPDPHVLLLAADVDRQQKRLDLAEARVDDAIAAMPDDPAAFVVRGQVLLDADRLDGAIDAFRRATELEDRYGRAHYMLGQALRKAGRADDARTHLERAEALGSSAPVSTDPYVVEIETLRTGAIEFLHAAIDRLKAGDVDDAIELLERSRTINPGLAETYSQLATAWLLKGDVDAAWTNVEAALGIDPDFVDALYHRGLIAYRRADLDVARAAFVRVAALRPDHFDAQLALGTVCEAMARTEEAVDAYEAAAALRREDERPVRRAVRTLITAGRDRAALAMAKEGLERFPQSVVLTERAAWLLATSTDETVRDASTSLAMAEDACRRTGFVQPQCLRTLAAAQAANGRYDDAMATIARALDAIGPAGDAATVEAMRAERAAYRDGRARPAS